MNDLYFPEDKISLRRSISNLPYIDKLTNGLKKVPIAERVYSPSLYFSRNKRDRLRRSFDYSAPDTYERAK